MKTCIIEGCTKMVHCGGTKCGMHYKRILKTGSASDPLNRIYRPAITEGNVAQIPIGVNATKGYATVDKEYAWLDKYKRYLNCSGYASTSINGKVLLLHHAIIGKPPKGLVTDHINRNKLDNRVCNLNHTSYYNNVINMGLRKDNKSGHKGVYLRYRNSGVRYVVYVVKNRKTICLGTYNTIEEAVIQRKNGELLYHGKYL